MDFMLWCITVTCKSLQGHFHTFTIFLSQRNFICSVFRSTIFIVSLRGVCACIYIKHYFTIFAHSYSCNIRIAMALTRFTVWCLVAACYLDLGRAKAVPTCVSVYHEFEEAAITNSSANVHNLFRTFYFPNHPLPFSVGIVYQVQLPNGTTARVSSDTSCPSELWMWTYSLVFLWFEPSSLNKLTLYAMNGVVHWKSPTVTLTVPLPCQNVSYSFLNEMTMAVSCMVHCSGTYPS